jgi:hypothetical protein
MADKSFWEKRQPLRVFEICTSLVHLGGFATTLVFMRKDRVVPLKRGYVVYPEDGGKITYGYNTGTSISIIGLISATFALSFVFQFFPAVIPALWRDTYGRLTKQGINFWRWIEYSFSATTLFLAGAASQGLNSLHTALLIFGSMWVVMMLGLLQEVVAYYLKEMNRTKVYLGEFLLPHLIGWIPYLFLWFVAFDTNALNNKHATPHKSNALFAFYIFEFVAFSSFGINQLAEMIRLHNQLQSSESIAKIAVQHEYIYTLLSLTSKTGGGAILLYGGLSLKGYY